MPAEKVIVQIIAFERIRYEKQIEFDSIDEARLYLAEYKDSAADDFIESVLDTVLDVVSGDDHEVIMQIIGSPSYYIELE